jgi:hypothetical protein
LIAIYYEGLSDNSIFKIYEVRNLGSPNIHILLKTYYLICCCCLVDNNIYYSIITIDIFQAHLLLQPL